MAGQQCIASRECGEVQVPGGGGWYSYPPPRQRRAPKIHWQVPPRHRLSARLLCTSARRLLQTGGNFPAAVGVGVSRCRPVWQAMPLPPTERARLGCQTLAFRHWWPTGIVILASVSCVKWHEWLALEVVPPCHPPSSVGPACPALPYHAVPVSNQGP